MPTITVDVENTEQTVTRRVVLDVVYDLIAAFGLPYTITIIYPGANDPEDLPVSVGKPPSTRNQTMKVMVQVEEAFVERDVATTVLKANEQRPIFRDSALNVLVSPIYARKRLIITVAIRFPDRNAALTQMHDMRRHATMHQDGLFHEVKYQYLIPKVNVVILREIHRLRERLAGYGEDLGIWLNEGFNDQAVTLSNADGSQRTLAKEEIQTGLLGTYDFEIVPEAPETNETKTSHTLNLTYTVEYDKPISTMMQYPLMVHNQPIDSNFYDASMPFELGHRLMMPSSTRFNTDAFTKNNYVTGFPMGAPVPTFLDWLPPTTPNATDGLLRVLCMVDPQDRYDVASFTALGQLTWRPEYLDYLVAERQWMTMHRHSPLFVALYEDDRMLGHDAIEIDEDLNVRSTFPMDLRKRYHLWVAILTNWEFLKSDAIVRLRNDGTMARTLMLGIDPNFPEAKLPGSLSGDYVPKRDFDKAVDDLNSRRVPVRGEPRHLNLRIGHFILSV
jgi:hypothetical protein